MEESPSLYSDWKVHPHIPVTGTFAKAKASSRTEIEVYKRKASEIQE